MGLLLLYVDTLFSFDLWLHVCLCVYECVDACGRAQMGVGRHITVYVGGWITSVTTTKSVQSTGDLVISAKEQTRFCNLPTLRVAQFNINL